MLICSPESGKGELSVGAGIAMSTWVTYGRMSWIWISSIMCIWVEKRWRVAAIMDCSKQKVDVYLGMYGMPREKKRKWAENCILWVSCLLCVQVRKEGPRRSSCDGDCRSSLSEDSYYLKGTVKVSSLELSPKLDMERGLIGTSSWKTKGQFLKRNLSSVLWNIAYNYMLILIIIFPEWYKCGFFEGIIFLTKLRDCLCVWFSQQDGKEGFLPRASPNSLLFKSSSLKGLSWHHSCQFSILSGLTGLIWPDLPLLVTCHVIRVSLAPLSRLHEILPLVCRPFPQNRSNWKINPYTLVYINWLHENGGLKMVLRCQTNFKYSWPLNNRVWTVWVRYNVCVGFFFFLGKYGTIP